MTKRRIAALFSAFMILCGVIGLATLPSDAAPTSTTVAQGTQSAQATFPLTGKKFSTRWICVQNNIGRTWDIDTADNWFESGSNTVVLYDLFPGEGDPPCSNFYYDNQILIVSTYNSNDGTCYQLIAPPTNVNGVYTTTVVIGMNVSAASADCRSTLQRRNNNISQALGLAFGLNLFYSTTQFHASIMNRYHENQYNYAGTDDRNALYNLY